MATLLIGTVRALLMFYIWNLAVIFPVFADSATQPSVGFVSAPDPYVGSPRFAFAGNMTQEQRVCIVDGFREVVKGASRTVATTAGFATIPVPLNYMAVPFLLLVDALLVPFYIAVLPYVILPVNPFLFTASLPVLLPLLLVDAEVDHSQFERVNELLTAEFTREESQQFNRLLDEACPSPSSSHYYPNRETMDAEQKARFKQLGKSIDFTKLYSRYEYATRADEISRDLGSIQKVLKDLNIPELLKRLHIKLRQLKLFSEPESLVSNREQLQEDSRSTDREGSVSHGELIDLIIQEAVNLLKFRRVEAQ